MDDLLEVRCPDCRSLDWFRDGFVMHEAPAGGVLRQRLTPSSERANPWACARCGYEVRGDTLLHRRLSAIQTVHTD